MSPSPRSRSRVHRSPSLQLLIALFAAVATLGWTPSAQAQADFYGLEQVLTGRVTANKNTTTQATVLEANAEGGKILVRMPDTAGKTSGDYEFTWQFLDDISKLVPGQEYRFTIVGKRVAGTAERNTNTAWLRSSNSGSKLGESIGLKTSPRCIDVVATPKSIVAFPVASKKNASTGVVKPLAGGVCDYSYFTFQFDFSSHPYSSTSLQCSFEVAYIYRKNFVPAAPTAGVKCPNLYDLGVNIGIVEHGTHSNGKSDFLIGFIDHALVHAKAANCIPAADIATLEDIKARMSETETSGSFAQEFSAYRQHLQSVIHDSCNCGDPVPAPADPHAP